MKKILAAFLLLVALVSVQTAQASVNIVGYVNRSFYAGDNLFQNPLDTTNFLSTLFGPGTPDGTTISLWNSGANAFTTTSEYLNGQWTLNLQLAPGTGAKLTTSTAFVNTFVGVVLNHDGSYLGDTFILPPVFSGPNGIYLLGDKCPIADSGSDVFLNVLGRGPHPGEQFIGFNALTQQYIVSTWNGSWDIIPSLAVGDAGFFNIGPVPEPSATALILLGLALNRARSRRG